MTRARWETYGRPPRKRFKLLWHRVFDGVRYLLMRHWNPVGGSVPHNEYDRYALTIAGMLLRNCSASEIAQYLAWAEHQMVAHGVDEVGRTSAVERLVEFRTEGYPPIAWNARFPGTYMLPGLAEH
jgi:hypothetical protein